MMPVYNDGRVHLYHGGVMDIAVRRLSSTPLPLPIDDGVVA